MKKFIENNSKIIIVCSVVVLTIAMITIASMSYAAGNNNIYTRDELSEKVDELTENTELGNLFLSLYPVGSIYTTTNSTNPASLYGGAWNLVFNDYDRIATGSQIIYDGLSGTQNVELTSLIGTTGEFLISGLFYNYAGNLETLTNYHREYRLSAQVSTKRLNYITLYINNIATRQMGSKSELTYRYITTSDYFKPSDVIQEPIVTHSNYNGYNLKYQVTGETGEWSFWDVTIHSYFVSDDIIYKWERTA